MMSVYHQDRPCIAYIARAALELTVSSGQSLAAFLIDGYGLMLLCFQ